MNPALFARFVQPLAVALGISLLSAPLLAFAQNDLGAVLDAGATKLSADDFKRDVVQRTIVGLTPAGGTLEIVFRSNGTIDGAGTPARGSPVQSGISGEWKIDDRDRVCTTMRLASGIAGGMASQAPSINLPTRCQFWFKVGEKYFLSDSDSDRQERVIQRTLKATIASFTPAAGAPLTLPKSMKGVTRNPKVGVNPWSMSVTKSNEDGTFDGFVTYIGRRCSANHTALTNGTLKDGEVRFDVAMGAECVATFTLRKGFDHFLEGQMVTKFSDFPDSGTLVWLDPEP